MNASKKFKSAFYIKALILSTSFSAWAVDAPAVTDFDVITYHYNTGEGSLNDVAGDEIWSPSNSTIIIRNDAGQVIGIDRTPNPAAILTTANLFVVANPTGQAYGNTVCTAPTYDNPTGQEAAFVIDPAHPIFGANPQAVRLTSALTAPGGIFEGIRDAAANWGRYVCHYTLNRTIAAAGAVPETNYAWNLFLINTAIPADPAIVAAEHALALNAAHAVRNNHAQARQAVAVQARNDAEAQSNIAMNALIHANRAQIAVTDLASAQANVNTYLGQQNIAQAAEVGAIRLVAVARAIRDELENIVVTAGAGATPEEIAARDAAVVAFNEAEAQANDAHIYVNAFVNEIAFAQAEVARQQAAAAALAAQQAAAAQAAAQAEAARIAAAQAAAAQAAAAQAAAAQAAAQAEAARIAAEQAAAAQAHAYTHPSGVVYGRR